MICKRIKPRPLNWLSPAQFKFFTGTQHRTTTVTSNMTKHVHIGQILCQGEFLKKQVAEFTTEAEKKHGRPDSANAFGVSVSAVVFSFACLN